MERIILSHTIVSNEILKSILNLDMNSESEDEMDELFYILKSFQLRGKRKKVVRIEGYVNNIIPRFTTNQFKEHFRMTPNCFQLLENKLSLLLSNSKKGRPFISPRVQLLATLWLLATPDSYR